MIDYALGLALVVGAFLLGSIPSGFLLARGRGVDIREVGSGNIGATNVTRSLGKKLGALVLVFDVLKGAVPMLVLVLSGLPERVDPFLLPATGMAAIAGHCFSPWLKFRGGKGVATAFGAVVVVAPVVAPMVVGVFAAVYAVTRVASLASLLGTLVLPVLLWVTGATDAVLTLGVAAAALIVVRHRSNIARLIRRREHSV